MSEVKTYKLGDVTVNFDARRVPVPARDRAPGPYPYYGASGIVDYVDDFLFDGEYLLIAEDGENLRTRKTPIAFVAEGKFWVNNHAHVVQGNHLANTRYLCYALARTNIAGFLTGSTQPKLTQTALNAIPIALPSREYQDQVVEILRALDDKIDSNRRTLRTVLDLAQAHFSLYARNVKIGPLTFGEVSGVFGGGTPNTSTSHYWNGTIAWATPTDITSLEAPYLFTTARTITESGLAQCASQLYPAGSIFMTSRATIGAFAVAQVPAAVNQGFIVVVPPRAELTYWLLHEMMSRVDEMRGLANGSTFLELSRTNFKKMPVRMPTEPDLAQFHETVAPLHHHAAALCQENVLLGRLRDTLLPGLMSGEIRVREAEKVVEEVL